jgi:hypothetical protein
MSDETMCERVARDFPGLAARMRERESLGLARYGRVLDPYDGRDWIREAREEVADAVVYCTAAAHMMAGQEQDKDGLVRWVRIREIRRRLAEVLEELEAL